MDKRPNLVVIFGPDLGANVGGYGAGKGGVVSAISRMLHYFDAKLQYAYCAYDTRKNTRLWFLWLPVRWIRAIIKLTVYILINKCRVIHIVADGLVYRTSSVVLVAKVFNKYTVVDVRGDGLRKYAENKCSFMVRIAWFIVLKAADRLLLQNKNTLCMMESHWKEKLHYHPNWINLDAHPIRSSQVLDNEEVTVAFVGYCYKDKGVFDIVNGCIDACENGMYINLQLVGHEELSFSNFLDGLIPPARLNIVRHGVQDRRNILDVLSKSDVFLFPSYYRGEGHPNVINEAMAFKLVIVSTPVGSIPDILDESTAYFVSPRSPWRISERLIEIQSNRTIARMKGENAFDKLIQQYTEASVLSKLLEIYDLGR